MVTVGLFRSLFLNRRPNMAGQNRLTKLLCTGAAVFDGRVISRLLTLAQHIQARGACTASLFLCRHLQLVLWIYTPSPICGRLPTTDS